MKNFVDTVEQKVLFTFVRILALLIIVSLCVTIYFAMSFYNSIGKSTAVSFAQVSTSVMTSTSSEQIEQYPPAVEKYLGGEKNREILKGWLESLSNEDKKDFIENLNSIIVEALAKGKDDDAILDMINSYRKVKLEKLQSTMWDEPFEKAQKGGVMLFISILLGMIGLFTLILVLLAIERNTRKQVARS